MSLKDDLRKKTQESLDTKDGGFSPTTYKIPAGVETFQPKLGANKIDIIPFKNKKGRYSYLLEFYHHTGIGLNNVRTVCLNKTYGQPCPICEERAEMKKKGEPWDSEEMKALKPTRRVMYNVIDQAEPEKGIQIFEVSHYLFERLLIEDAKDEDGELLVFADLEDGKTISFKGREKEWNGRKSISEFDSFLFLDRKKPYSEKLLSKSHCLDDIITPKTYEELQALFLGAPDFEEDEEEIDEEEAQEVSEADDMPFPSESQETREDTPRKKKKVQAVPETQECPHGNIFGKEYDLYEECDECELNRACGKANAST